MSYARTLALLVLLLPLAPASACPFHGDMFGEGGGFLFEPVSAGAVGAAAADAQPVQSREELMARQRALFLERYPQLAAGSTDKPPVAENPADRAEPRQPRSGNR